MQSWGRVLGGLTLAAALAAQTKADYDTVKAMEHFSGLLGLQKVTLLMWLVAFVVTLVACVACVAGTWRITLALSGGALALNLLSTGLSIANHTKEGLTLGGSFKVFFFGYYDGAQGFMPSLLFAGIVTLGLLALAVLLVVAARDRNAQPRQAWAPQTSSAPAGAPAEFAPAGVAVPSREQPAWTPAPAVLQRPAVAAPGWYPHPSGNGSLGYWDGSGWVELTAPTQAPAPEDR